MLELEALTWHHAGAKESAINERFGLSATRYYQQLARLIETEAALAHNPILVNRLRRARDAKPRGRRRLIEDSTAAA